MLVRRASTYCNPLLAHSLLPLIGQGNNLPFAHRRKVFFLFIKGKLPFDSLTIWFNSFPMLVHAFIIHYAFCEKRGKDIFWRPTTHDTATKITHQKFGTYIIAWTVWSSWRPQKFPQVWKGESRHFNRLSFLLPTIEDFTTLPPPRPFVWKIEGSLLPNPWPL